VCWSTCPPDNRLELHWPCRVLARTGHGVKNASRDHNTQLEQSRIVGMDFHSNTCAGCAPRVVRDWYRDCSSHPTERKEDFALDASPRVRPSPADLFSSFHSHPSRLAAYLRIQHGQRRGRRRGSLRRSLSRSGFGGSRGADRHLSHLPSWRTGKSKPGSTTRLSTTKTVRADGSRSKKA
jgi:hypothetical protein